MQSRRACILLICMQMIFLVPTHAQEVDKRVPQGFVGMRGKKYVDSAEIEQFYKRKPNFFVGVKGKKSVDDLYENNELFSKRVPMDFVGVRGKKEYSPDSAFADNYMWKPRFGGSLIGQIDYTANEDFMGSHDDVSFLYKFLANDLRRIKHSLEQTSDSQGGARATDDQFAELTNGVNKRIANIHQFFGVRGKKSVGTKPLQDKRPYDLTFRGKFIGVRGKKAVKATDVQEIQFLLGQNGPWPKRRAQMGFFGMRGKKWTDDSSSEMDKTN